MAKTPIVYSVVDVWHDGKLPPAVYMGMLMSDPSFGYVSSRETGMAQIPEAIRKQEQGMKYQPMYEITSTDGSYRVVIGEAIFGVAMLKDYTTWEVFKSEIVKVLDTIFFKSPFKLQRIGMKYVNFLSDENVFETGKIKIKINDTHYSGKFSSIQMQKDIDKISIAQTVVYPLKLNQVLPVHEDKTGSLIDLVASVDNIDEEYSNREFFIKALDELHDLQEKEFGSIVSDELARKLNIVK